jgi:hypothetical protein
VVLEGLAQARDLVLIADRPTVQYTQTYMPFVLVDYSLLNYIYIFRVRKLSLLIAIIYFYNHAFPPSKQFLFTIFFFLLSAICPVYFQKGFEVVPHFFHVEDLGTHSGLLV